VLQVSSVHVYLTYPFVLSWSMLEAMSCGCRLVASATPPVMEVIRDGVNGLLVDFFSPEEIAAKVIDVLTNPGRFEDMRQNARRTIVEKYDSKRVCLPAQVEYIKKVSSEQGA
jgi:glycosyltransferase involved in cell wall biosynthesis